MPNAHITGWGMSAPESILTNDDISKMVETNDQWIRERTGIRERRVAWIARAAAFTGCAGLPWRPRRFEPSAKA